MNILVIINKMTAKRLAELNKIVAESYELTAGHFDATRSKVAAPDFLWAANQIGGDDVVFDAGCGNGRLLDYSSLSPRQYLGFDQSENLIDLARQHHRDYKFIAGDLSNINSLVAGAFSVIFCSAVLSHIPGKNERQQVLKSLLSISQPGARLVISFWKLEGKHRERLWRAWWLKIRGQYHYGWRDLVFPWKNAQGEIISQRYYYAFTMRGFKSELKKAGWVIDSCRNDRFNYWVVAHKPQ